MEKVRLGRTNLMVSRIGFGGIPIQRDTTEEAVAVVKRCLEHGITFLDTAHGYTTSEERIGKAIAGLREGVYIATKTHSRDLEELEKDLNMSLRRLDTNYIDIYQFHNVSDGKSLEIILAPNGPLSMLEEYKKKGVVRHIGITSHSIDIAKEAVKTDRFENLMIPFNFVADEAADELLPLARKHDVGFIAMKSMAGGIVDNSTLAMKYLFQFPDVVPIPGIEKVQEIDEIIRVLNGSWRISEAEQQEMRRIKAELGRTFCHRCDYCQPCQQNIPISTVMTFQSFLKRVPPERVFTGRIANSMEKAADCIECGDCENRCPYHLPIIETIAKYHKWYAEKKQEYLASIGQKPYSS
ncbi:aldo/keto reductase [Chloroflexota bacterium]